MSTRYRIYAYSQTHHQKQQSMDLLNNTQLSDPVYAQQMAQSYAQRLNQNFFMHAVDWTPSIEAYEHEENPTPFQLPGLPTG